MAVAIVLLIVTVSCKKDVHVTGVTLDKNNITLDVGATKTLIVIIQPVDATNKNTTWESSNTSVATVQNGFVVAITPGTTTITVHTEDGNKTATCTVTVTPVEPEEQGIVINGIKWATRNVDKPGTFAAKPEDSGMFYQWNRKTGWSVTDPMINSNGGTTWDKTPADGDTWAKVNDPCPTGWRVPTLEELQSLIYAGSEWTTLNGINGCSFGDGENTLFLSAAGFRNKSGLLCNAGGGSGQYWSSSVYTIYPTCAYAYSLHFRGGSIIPSTYIYNDNCATGFSVRCVAE